MNCKICHSFFSLSNPNKNPRILTQCGHTFCSQCISSSLNNSNLITCIQCGKHNSITSQTIFPLNQTLISILKNHPSEQFFLQNQYQICTKHKQKLEAFCENDKQLLCLNCILAQHKSHKILAITEKVKNDKQQMKILYEGILSNKKVLELKIEQSNKIIDGLKLDFQEYVFQINLLHKNVVNQIKQLEQEMVLQAKKSIDSSIQQIKIMQCKIKQKISLYQQLDVIYNQMVSKSNVQYIKETQIKKVIKENYDLKDKFSFSCKKKQVNKQKILIQIIRELQQLISYERRKNGNTNEVKLISAKDKKSSSIIDKKISSIMEKKNESISYQTKNINKQTKLSVNKQSISLSNSKKEFKQIRQKEIWLNGSENINQIKRKSMQKSHVDQSLNQSPQKITKKRSSVMQKNVREPQILEVNLLEKYEKYQQERNIKKSISQSNQNNSNKKSPKIQYQVKMYQQSTGKQKKYEEKFDNSLYLSHSSFLHSINFPQNQIQKYAIQHHNQLNQSQNTSQHFLNSFLNQSQITCSPNIQRLLQSNQRSFEVSTPLSIKSFMESQFTNFDQKRQISLIYQHNGQQTILKDSKLSFTIASMEQEILHFGGLKNHSIDCTKFHHQINQTFNIRNQTLLQGLSRSKCQCVIIKHYNPKKILIIGGKDGNGQRCCSILQFDIVTNKLEKSPFEMNEAISGFGAIVFDKKLYIFGGNSSLASKSLYQYKIEKKMFSVKKLSSMINSRDQLGFALGYDGFIYACGGINSSNVILNSCQKYCFKSNKWYSIQPMKIPRRSFSIISLPNGLFAIGGHDGKSSLSSVEMYSYELEKWIQVSSLNRGRFAHTGISTNDYQNIMVFGGFDGGALKSIEIYNVMENRWVERNQMINERYLHCSISIRE